MLGTGLLVFGSLAGLRDNCLLRGLGIAAGFFEHPSDFVGGFGETTLVGDEHPLRFLVGLPRLGNLVLDPLLTLVETVHDRLPGKLAEKPEEEKEHRQRPDRQVTAELSGALKVFLGNTRRRVVADLDMITVPVLVMAVGFSVGRGRHWHGRHGKGDGRYAPQQHPGNRTDQATTEDTTKLRFLEGRDKPAHVGFSCITQMTKTDD